MTVADNSARRDSTTPKRATAPDRSIGEPRGAKPTTAPPPSDGPDSDDGARTLAELPTLWMYEIDVSRDIGAQRKITTHRAIGRSPTDAVRALSRQTGTHVNDLGVTDVRELTDGPRPT